jgi:hypothetical protein
LRDWSTDLEDAGSDRFAIDSAPEQRDQANCAFGRETACQLKNLPSEVGSPGLTVDRTSKLEDFFGSINRELLCTGAIRKNRKQFHG